MKRRAPDCRRPTEKVPSDEKARRMVFLAEERTIAAIVDCSSGPSVGHRTSQNAQLLYGAKSQVACLFFSTSSTPARRPTRIERARESQGKARLMAANLRSSIGRMARRFSEDLLVVFGAPRPHPAAAPSAAEAGLLSRKVNDVAGNDWTIEFAESLIKGQKKKIEPQGQEWKTVPWIFAMFYLSTLIAGYHVGRDHSARASGHEIPNQGK